FLTFNTFVTFVVKILILIIPISILILSYSKKQIEIQYTILRDRVIVIDHVLMKKALYVAFNISDQSLDLNGAQAVAKLYHNDQCLTESSTFSSGEQIFNLIFDLPYEIPGGQYIVNIEVSNKDGKSIAKDSHSIKRKDMKSVASSDPGARSIKYQEIPAPIEPEYLEPSVQDIERGYILFSRSPLEYIFPGSRPKKEEVIDQLSTTVCRNEFEPITFTIYPLKDLGEVTVSIDDLTGNGNIIPKDNVELAFLEEVEQTTGFPSGQFQRLPRMIRPGNKVKIQKNRCQRCWLTLKIEKDTIPGEYTTLITISPQYGKIIQFPLSVEVVPITLEDIPGIDYFMLMTYEFTELTLPWSEENKKKIYDSACKILQGYKDHGMTTLCIHSPLIQMTKEDGSTNLDDIYATLIAARDLGFTRPIIWYLGHLIQTAKPRHPGNIQGFDESVHIPRLKRLVNTISRFAEENHCPEVIFLPIDEADDAYQDTDNRRGSITPRLLKAIKENGGSTMLTATRYDQFKPVDFICSGKFDPDQLQNAHTDGSLYYFYNNKVTTDCVNPSYARFVYGYYTWASGIDGMTSWTFQNTQNAAGDPTKADAPGRDLYLAYPHPDGPLSTLEWEAVREGIDDYKLIYQLERRIQSLASHGADTSKYEMFISKIKQGITSDYPESALPFSQLKEEIISTILDLGSLN
ncbi:MAG: DUF4091 domain-containing protein, partial [Deltaproteobacteria bacterium]|nr:DUF4091 domain-containing protein [Deltaproteobacteria bacterium]